MGKAFDRDNRNITFSPSVLHFEVFLPNFCSWLLIEVIKILIKEVMFCPLIRTAVLKLGAFWRLSLQQLESKCIPSLLMGEMRDSTHLGRILPAAPRSGTLQWLLFHRTPGSGSLCCCAQH